MRDSILCVWCAGRPGAAAAAAGRTGAGGSKGGAMKLGDNLQQTLLPARKGLAGWQGWQPALLKRHT